MILRPQYTQRPVEILLIGPASSGKRTLARQLIKSRDTYITTSTLERFRAEYLKDLKSCDYFLLMVDLLNRTSLYTLRDTLSRIASQYLVDRCAVVITKVDASIAWTMEDQEIRAIIDSYAPEMYVFRANLTDDEDRQVLCNRIVRIVRTSALQQKGVSTALVKSAVYYHQIPYSARSIESTSYDEDRGSSRISATEIQEAALISANSDKNGGEDAEETAQDAQQDAKDATEDIQEDVREESMNADSVKERDEDAKDSVEEKNEQQTAQ